MTRHRRLSEAQLDEMARLRERGWGVDRIAAHFTAAGTSVSPSTIDWQCMRLGADAPPRLRGTCRPQSRPYMRNGTEVRPWTDADDRILLSREAAGVGQESIAAELGRAGSSVRGRLLTLARRQARAEDLAG